MDRSSGKEITVKEEFIECLTHDCIVIQTPELKKSRVTLLEKVLSVFGESGSKRHLLEINEEDYPEKYREIIRRLIKAASKPEMRQTMDVEDEIVDYVDNLAREIAEKQKAIEKKNQELEQKDHELVQKDHELVQKDHELVQKDHELEQKKVLLEQKDQALARALELLKKAGIDAKGL